MSAGQGWIGVDLDGTVAHYDQWRGDEHVGAAIPAMVERIHGWLQAGVHVKIFTARVWGIRSPDPERRAKAEKAHGVISTWCIVHIGRALEITNEKDYDMIELWDDRAVQVRKNTGERVG